MKSLLTNKQGRFAIFWILLGILGVLLIGSFITPINLVLDNTFNNMEESAIANGNHLSCTDSEAPPLMKATCFTLGGFLVMFIFYLLYSWISGMINGATAPSAIFSPRYKAMQRSLEG